MQKIFRWIRGELPSLLFIVLLLAARSSLADHYYVPSGSMEHTLVPGDRVAVAKAAYNIRVPFTDWVLWHNRDPQPGEVVVFNSPHDGKLLIKRAVAVGGDYVKLRNGRLTVNGKPLADSRLGDFESFNGRSVLLNLEDGGGPDIGGLLIPQGMVLMLGDHRGNSADGRFFGLIPANALYGRALGIYYRREKGFTWNSL